MSPKNLASFKVNDWKTKVPGYEQINKWTVRKQENYKPFCTLWGKANVIKFKWVTANVHTYSSTENIMWQLDNLVCNGWITCCCYYQVHHSCKHTKWTLYVLHCEKTCLLASPTSEDPEYVINTIRSINDSSMEIS